MNLWDYLAVVMTALVSWPAWTYIHEASHVFVARLMAPLLYVQWFMYPHKDEKGNFYFARVQWMWEARPNSSPATWALLHSAPRVMNVLAAVMLPLMTLFDTPWSFVWAAFWAAGLIDFFVGSIGINEYTDLKRTAKVLDVSPWLLRVLGMSMIAVSIALTVWSLFR